MASVVQDEVRKLSERVSFGMKRSIDNGVVLGCSNISGYTKDNGKLVIDEEYVGMRINAFKAHLKYSNEKNMDKLLSNLDKNI